MTGIILPFLNLNFWEALTFLSIFYKVIISPSSKYIIHYTNKENIFIEIYNNLNYVNAALRYLYNAGNFNNCIML